MKICILPGKIAAAVSDLVERVTKAKDSTALLAVDDEQEALVVMTWTKYEELLKAASAPKEVHHHDHYRPYWSYPYWYTGTTTITPNITWGNITVSGTTLPTSDTSYTVLTSSSDKGMYGLSVNEARTATNVANLISSNSGSATALWADANE